MSSPSGRSEETRSQDSVHASSQFAASTALEDTASSMRHTRHLPGGSSTVTSRAPNAAFSRRMADTRARSASPGPRRSPSLLGMSVVQGRTRLAEQTTVMAISSVGRVEAEACCVCKIVEATTAEARSVRDEVESRVASLAALADASASHAKEVTEGRSREVAAYSDAQTSRIAVEVTQRLESEIVADATSTAATADITTRTTVEGVRRDIQAQIEQTGADALRCKEEAKHRVEQISMQLQSLTEQLKKFKPTSEHTVGVVQEQVTEQLQKRFEAQTERMDQLSAIIVESQK